MKSRLQGWFLITVLMTLAGCVPARPDIFPPQLSIDALRISGQGSWQLVLRIKNDSYASMTFRHLEGQLLVDGQAPLRMSADMDLEIPALAADVTRVEIPATAALHKVLTDSRHTPFGLPYRFSGQVVTGGSASGTRHFDFSHDDRFYPVPGDARRFR
ncbi:LEA type 2 family protein [Frateuria aurantia]|uniref:Late embryogenesis abundant protein n=1 Tax=Frateuria aurantia (strain ATCC 33424 / DSM 6220 / KCTC 2777 / LMG 1558 / NBRC 3245 / NCIMB 13370) TaxID=767434 RepID=H8KZY1_FRAAD|nr:LEA type 2 family protein [Frateuria aurantia]AFC85262.1 hypothetical protein Fraau_0791 [Frateuria aurantia DSM 6220]